MIINTDIDIDVLNREDVLSKIKHVDASTIKNGELTKHVSGVYFQNIPKNPFTNISTIPYDEAENLGYLKIDILNNNLYNGVKDEVHLVELMSREPVWELLYHEDFVTNLHHLSKYHKLLLKLKPKSIEDIAMILAIIRPAKSYLQYKSWDEIREKVWEREEEGYQFKKSHAISYAVSIVVQMNLLVELLHASDESDLSSF